MTLADLRKVTVKKRVRIRFGLSNGMECVVTEQGVARVPALRSAPAFNLENELSLAQSFTVEPVDNDKGKAKPRICGRDEVAAMAAGGGPETHADEHDE